MAKVEQRIAIIEALESQGLEVLYGKGGFFIRGEGWISFAQARKRSGVAAPDELKRNSYEKPKAMHPLAFIAKSGW